MSDIHARTSAAFLADAKARCDAAASIPADAAAADQAIAAIEAGLIESGAVEAPRPAYMAVQCTHVSSPDRGSYLYSGDHPRTGRLVSPIFRDTLELYRWIDANGYVRAPYDAAHPCGVYTKAPAMVPQQAQQQQGRAASPILQRLAEANAALAAIPHRPGMPGFAWRRAFDAREDLAAMAVAADPIAYVRAYPSHAMAYRHLLPADMVARVEGAETEADMIAAVAP